MDKMKQISKKNIKRNILLFVILTTFLCAFHVPTRVAAWSFNRNTNLPISLLARNKDADFSNFAVEHGFGMTSYYHTEYDGTYLRVDVSMWPDAIFGKQRIDYASWTKDNITVFDFSVGDELSVAEQALRRNGFVKTRNSDEFRLQYRKFGLIITCFPDRDTGIIKSISVSVQGTNIFGIVY